MVGAMKPAFYVIAIFVASFLSSVAEGAERRYSLTDFERVQIDGPFQVRLSTGLSTAGSATGSPEALERVSVEVQGSTLRVRPNRSGWGGFPGQSSGPAPVITIRTRTLRAAVVNGSGSLSIDKAAGLRVELTVAGSGRLTVAAVQADNLAITMLGAGKLSLAGKAKQVKAVLQGSPELDAPGLSVDDLQLTTESAGNVALAAVHTAKVRSTGAGDVIITGPAACTVEALGAGTVRCGRTR
jgi:hypothetical protein